MIETLSHFMAVYVIPLGPLGVFLASITEEIIAPIPSALVMMTSGFLFVSGPANFHNILRLVLYVGIPSGLGVAFGSLVIYGIAYWGGKTFVDKWGKWLGLYWSDVEKMRERFEKSKSGEAAVIGARVVPFVPSVAISAFCGFIRMNLYKYLLLTFVGMFLRGVLMGAIGWQVGNVYLKYEGFFANLEQNVTMGIIALILIFGVYLLYKKNRKTDERI